MRTLLWGRGLSSWCKFKFKEREKKVKPWSTAHDLCVPVRASDCVCFGRGGGRYHSLKCPLIPAEDEIDPLMQTKLGLAHTTSSWESTESGGIKCYTSGNWAPKHSVHQWIQLMLQMFVLIIFIHHLVKIFYDLVIRMILLSIVVPTSTCHWDLSFCSCWLLLFKLWKKGSSAHTDHIYSICQSDKW